MDDANPIHPKVKSATAGGLTVGTAVGVLIVGALDRIGYDPSAIEGTAIGAISAALVAGLCGWLKSA